MERAQRKVCVIGLDCASPQLIFHQFNDRLPAFRKIMEQGEYAPMRSIHPPITIPAWMSMCSGQDAGQMGIYGFRSRTGNSYTDFGISSSRAFRHVPKLWDRLGAQGKKSILIGIPPSYPVYPVEGWMIAGFLCPDTRREFTYPKELQNEINEVARGYQFDVSFRTHDRDRIIKSVWEMTEKRFDVIEHLLTRKPWDFCMSVEIGLDRVHHAFWKYFDRMHHLYEPGTPYEEVIPEYYALLDARIGRVMDILQAQDATLYVVSDHGAKAMKGALCVNEWLIEQGYLVLKSYPDRPMKLAQAEVDWSRTKAWAWGGYYARIFLNVAGREAQGIVSGDEYEPLRDELKTKLTRQKGPSGESLATAVYRPRELYADPQGTLPDLMAYFDDLSYRSAGTVGHRTLFLRENDTGPDDAMHDWDGVYMKYRKDAPARGRVEPFCLREFSARVAQEMGIR